MACAEKRQAALARLGGNVAHADIEFIHGSLLTAKWQDGDLVFCHGTCFNDQYVAFAACIEGNAG